METLRRERERLGGATPLVIPSPPLRWSGAKAPVRPHVLAAIIHDLPEMTLLKTCNHHPRDALLVFVSSTHTYYIDDSPTIGSVTGLAHAFGQDFSASDVIHKMISGPNWPRPAYLQPIPIMLQMLTGVVGEDRLRAELVQDNFDEDSFCRMTKQF